MKIAGRVAIVFGAARGIGRAYVEALLDNGAKVCLTDRLADEGKKTTEELQHKYSPDQVFFKLCDVCSDADIKDVFRETTTQYGEVTIVVNNCGIIHEFDWQKCVDVNLGGNIRIVNETIARMGKNKGGSGGVVIVTSSLAGLQPQEWGPVYAATKHAIVGYLRSWALERNYKEHGIRMNCICSTRVDTPFLQQVTPERMHHAQEHLDLEQQASDTMRPEEIARAMVMLIEDDSLNGQAMRVTKECGYDFATFQEHPIQ